MRVVSHVIREFPLLQKPYQQSVEMPVGSEIVAVAHRGSHPTLWARCDPDAMKEERRFTLVGTGKFLDPKCKYHGVVFDGPTPWHIIEIPESGWF